MDTPASLTSKRIGCIGCGNMGRAMLAGALNAGLTTPERISVHTHTDAHQQKIAADYGVQALASNRDVAAESEIIVLAVKPNIYKDVILDIRDVLTAGQIVVAIAPAYSIRSIAALVDNDAVAIARATVRPPRPESNTPIGRVSPARLSISDITSPDSLKRIWPHVIASTYERAATSSSAVATQPSTILPRVI